MQAKNIENPISRVHALQSILGTILATPKDISRPVLAEFADACGKIKSCKVDQSIRHVAHFYFEHDPDLIMKLVHSMTNRRIQKKALAEVARSSQ